MCTPILELLLCSGGAQQADFLPSTVCVADNQEIEDGRRNASADSVHSNAGQTLGGIFVEIAIAVDCKLNFHYFHLKPWSALMLYSRNI